MRILINNDSCIADRFLVLIEKYEDKDKIKIMTAIAHIVNNYNWKPIPPTAKPLFETWEEELFEFRISLSKTLIRINYFIDYENDYLIVLNAYEKPNGAKDKNSYNKAKKKEIDTMIKKSISKALKLKKDYFISNQYYEFYN